MLGSSNCWLAGKSEKELAEMKECPYDPRGYFIIRGVEKVILIREQMSKNRVIVEYNKDRDLVAAITSKTYLTTSVTRVVFKNETLFLLHNSLTAQVPMVVVFKAMGMLCDQEI